MPKDEEAVFCLKIDYEVGTENPGRVFRSMALLISSFTQLDGVLEETVGIKGSPTILLEDIESGSLKAWLRNSLESIDDGALGDLSWKKAVGSFLVRGKRRLLETLRDQPTLDSREDISRIQRVVSDVARETGVTRLPIYTPPNAERLLRAASNVSQAVGELRVRETASYLSEDGAVEIGRAFAASKEKIEALLTREIVPSTGEMVLKVKKPDYLGVSMWEFRHGDHPIAARIEDVEWLRGFQMRDVDVRPGDSLRATVRTEVRYGYHSEIVSVHHTILQVLETIPLEREAQLELDDTSSEGDGTPPVS